jgi:DNA-binding protein HU-beta
MGWRPVGRAAEDERKSNVSKQILVDALKKSGLKTSDAANAVDTVVGAIGKELKKSQKFGIPGFGSFYVSKRAARMGRNPRTGEAIKIKASKGVRFKAGAKLKGSL